MSKLFGSAYRAGRTDQWLKMKNPEATLSAASATSIGPSAEHVVQSFDRPGKRSDAQSCPETLKSTRRRRRAATAARMGSPIE